MEDTLSKYFCGLEDPRSLCNQRHPFMTLIGTSLLAALSGIDSFSGIQDFVDMHMDSLKEYFDFPHGVPSHDTYQRLWACLSPTQFKSSFSEFIASLEKVMSDVISIDGKILHQQHIKTTAKNQNLVFQAPNINATQIVFVQLINLNTKSKNTQSVLIVK